MLPARAAQAAGEGCERGAPECKNSQRQSAADACDAGRPGAQQCSACSYLRPPRRLLSPHPSAPGGRAAQFPVQRQAAALWMLIAMPKTPRQQQVLH